MKRANHTPATFLQFTAFHTASMYKAAVLEHSCENPLASTNQLSVGVAQNLEDLIDCQRLRYLVFNCELARDWKARPETASIATVSTTSLITFWFATPPLASSWEPTACRAASALKVISAITANNSSISRHLKASAPKCSNWEEPASTPNTAILPCSTCSGKASPGMPQAVAPVISWAAVPSARRTKTKASPSTNR